MKEAYSSASAKKAAAAIKQRLGGGSKPPVLAMVLGSGLGRVASVLENSSRVSFKDVPGFPAVTVEGHAGEVVSGQLEGRDVLAVAGRFHMYEGHPAAVAAFPVRVVHALGARTLFLSNAAGGIRRQFRAGDLMIIEDHINLMFQNPLIGPVEKGEERFPDMSEAYDAKLRRLLREAAAELDIQVHEGVYAGLLGPAYETRAEIRMLEKLGADAVGMSTVPEVLVARALGMRVAAVSCITNVASGLSAAPVTHAEVLDTSSRVADQFEKLVRRFVRAL